VQLRQEWFWHSTMIAPCAMPLSSLWQMTATMSNWQTVGDPVWRLRLNDDSHFFLPAISL
jgi:hypothetical protein